MKSRKVVIIGDGMVGSSTAYTLMLKPYINEIVIIDSLKDKAEGDVLDMVQGLPFVSPKKIKAGTYEDVKGSHIVIITAGVSQKPEETRTDLLKRNMKIFDSILTSLKPFLDDDMIILVVTNPVDILSYYTYKKLGIPSSRVIGSGTALDSSRLKHLLSQQTDIDPRNIHAYVIGEHGDSEVSAFSVSSIAGIPLKSYCETCEKMNDYTQEKLNELHNKVVNAAYEIISKKGATYYAIALSIEKIVDTILNNQNSVLTVSTLIQNKFDGEIDDVYLSLPTVVNTDGIVRIIDLPYSYEEVLKLISSSKKLKSLYKDLEI